MLYPDGKIVFKIKGTSKIDIDCSLDKNPCMSEEEHEKNHLNLINKILDETVDNGIYNRRTTEIYNLIEETEQTETDKELCDENINYDHDFNKG